MRRSLFPIIAVILLGLMPPDSLIAQSDTPDLSLGDLARSLRKSKGLPAHTVIDNENLTQVMDDVESQRLNGHLLFSFDGLGKSFKVSSPDVTCSLSFNAQATSLISDPYVPVSLPPDELAKLEGPATVDGDNLQVSVFNGTGWNLREITVGLTILRRTQAANYYGAVKLLPASAADSIPAEKHSDITVLYHLKGAAAPFATTVFRETLGTALTPDQDWHWAIVEAKGFPPR
jgi:hypothetical protein